MSIPAAVWQPTAVVVTLVQRHRFATDGGHDVRSGGIRQAERHGGDSLIFSYTAAAASMVGGVAVEQEYDYDDKGRLVATQDRPPAT